MKRSAKMLSFMLSLMLVVTMAPAPAFAEDQDVQADEEAAAAVEVSAEEAEVAAEEEVLTEEAVVAEEGEEPQAAAAEEAEAPEQEVVYQDNPAHEGLTASFDKADYYVESEDARARSGQTRAYNLEPRTLSDEMKYFAKYESSCNYNQGFSWGDGYHAVGYYQFDIRYGLYDFMMACYEYKSGRYSMFKQFQGQKSAIQSTTGQSALGQKIEAAWHAAYAKAPKEFSELQDAWAYREYYQPAYKYLKNRGVDLNNYSDCVKGLCWGMSNLFGTGGWRKFVGGVTSGYDWNGVWQNSYDWPGAGLTNDMTDIQFVTTLCGYVTNNVGVFYVAQPEYHYGWESRYMRELMDCRSFLGKSTSPGLVYEYNYATGKYSLRWKKADGSYLKKAWKTVDGKRYRFNASGNALYDAPSTANMWLVNGNRYLINKDHSVYMGWKTWSDGTISYLAPKYNGKALKGWWTISGKRYRFNSNYRVLRGTWWVDGRRYYSNSATGVILTGWKTWSDGSRSYFSPKHGGAAAKGWWTIGGNRYYFSRDTRKTLRYSRWIGGEMYYFKKGGSIYTGWITWGEDGRKSYFLASGGGKAVCGWHTINGKKYYFDSARKALANGWHTINGKKYYFDENGVHQPNATA